MSVNCTTDRQEALRCHWRLLVSWGLSVWPLEIHQLHLLSPAGKSETVKHRTLLLWFHPHWKRKDTFISILSLRSQLRPEKPFKVLLIMDHCGAVLGSSLLFYQVEKLKGVADGTVWVWPVGCLVAFHLQNVVILSWFKEVRAVSVQGCAQFLCFITLQSRFTDLCSFHYVLLHHQHVLVGQTNMVLTLLSDSECLIADGLPFARPQDTRLWFLFRLTIQDASVYPMWLMSKAQGKCNNSAVLL